MKTSLQRAGSRAKSMLAAAALAAGVLFGTSGCSTGPSPTAAYKNALTRTMDAHNFYAAEELVEENKETAYGERNAVLFWLDQAVLLHDTGFYRESEMALDNAERRIEELFTKSRSKSTQRYFINDATEDFRGEPYVRTLLHIYRALNALFTRKSDDAAVEARKVTRFLQDLKDDASLKISYDDDAFAHLISALALEDSGDQDNAAVSLRKAAAAYRKQVDLYRTPIPYETLKTPLFIAEESNSSRGASPQTSAETSQEQKSSEAVKAIDWRTVKLVRTDERPAEEQEVQSDPDAASTSTDAGTGASDASEASAESVTAQRQAGEEESLSSETPAELQAEAPKADAGTESGAASASAAAAESDAPKADGADSQEGSEAQAQVQMTAAKQSEPTLDGELVFIHFAGKMPTLTERRIQVGSDAVGIYIRQHPEELNGRNWSDVHMAAISGESFVIALPEFTERPSVIQNSSIWCTDGSCSADTEQVANLEAIAEKTFEEQIGEITARAGARVAIKYALTKTAQGVTYAAARQLGGQGGSTAASVISYMVGVIGRSAAASTEAADTRSWLTAPAQIRIARIRLKPGKHNIRIFLKDARGNVVLQRDMNDVVIRPGKRTYEHLRTAY